MRLADEATGETVEWKYEGGMAAYLQESLAGEEGVVSPVIVGESYCGEGDPQFAQGEGAAWALAWCEGGGGGESYVNLIPTVEGGTHESGLKSGVFDSIREFCLHHELLTRGVTLQTEDVWKNLRFVLSARMLDPQFQGQTKAKLNSRDAVKLVASRLKDPLDAWLNQHVEVGKKIAELAIRAAVARQKAGKATEKRRGSGVAVLPGKLTDCESEEIARNELFLVEGDSAGGSARQGRDRHFQAILPLRGKILNTFEVDPTQIYANNEVHDIAVALGIEPHGLAGGGQGARGPALRQGHHHGRRGRRRLAHPDAAAGALLPAFPGAAGERARVRRAAAALLREGRRPGQEPPRAPPLRAGRGGARRDPRSSSRTRRCAKAPSTSAASRAWAR